MADTRPKDDKPLFGRPWIFIRGVPAMKFLPPEGPAEIALPVARTSASRR